MRCSIIIFAASQIWLHTCRVMACSLPQPAFPGIKRSIVTSDPPLIIALSHQQSTDMSIAAPDSLAQARIRPHCLQGAATRTCSRVMMIIFSTYISPDRN